MILARLTSGKLSKKLGTYRTIMLGFLIVSAAFFMISTIKTTWMLYLCACVYGFGAGICFPMLQVLTMSGVSRMRRGTANSTYLACFDIGSGVGASIWGYTIDFAGYYSIIYFIAGFIMLFDICLAFVLSKKFPSQY